MATGLIQVRTKYIAPAEVGLPGLAVQITRLVDSYMIWVGTTEGTTERVEEAPLSGLLCRDWACAMPTGSATTLCRMSGSDAAFSMAQRLAKRVGKPVFLSVDVASSSLLMDAEKGIILGLESSSLSSSGL